MHPVGFWKRVFILGVELNLGRFKLNRVSIAQRKYDKSICDLLGRGESLSNCF